MPMFEFICNECGEKFEVLLFTGEYAKCPKCSNKNVTKQFSNFVAMSSSVGRYCVDSCPTAVKHKCCDGCCHH
jgi:putative FmdB family regulatory protein